MQIKIKIKITIEGMILSKLEVEVEEVVEVEKMEAGEGMRMVGQEVQVEVDSQY